MARVMKPKLRKADDLSTLDEFLESEGIREAFQAVAIKEVLDWPIEQAMKTGDLG